MNAAYVLVCLFNTGSNWNTYNFIYLHDFSKCELQKYKWIWMPILPVIPIKCFPPDETFWMVHPPSNCTIESVSEMVTSPWPCCLSFSCSSVLRTQHCPLVKTRWFQARHASLTLVGHPLGLHREQTGLKPWHNHSPLSGNIDRKYR